MFSQLYNSFGSWNQLSGQGVIYDLTLGVWECGKGMAQLCAGAAVDQEAAVVEDVMAGVVAVVEVDVVEVVVPVALSLLR